MQAVVAPAPEPLPSSPQRPQVIVVTTALLVFISFWRAAAIVLCDLASTAYYIGGIVEQAIGKAAPWFIGAVMLFSYAVRAVYVESCAMFVRGGVYRVVKEAMGGTLAKLSVSALMFDYVLTGPISGVSAGQYIVGLTNELLPARARPARHRARLGLGRHCDRDHALLLAPEHPRHPGVERQGHEDHGRHERHGRPHARLVQRDDLDARRDACRPSGSISATSRSAGSRAPSWATADRRARHPDRVRPLDPRHERRGVAGAGVPRDRVSQAEEPETRRAGHLRSTAWC